MDQPILRADRLRKVFRQPHGKIVEAVREATLEVRRGEVLGLLGPNGAGKTTLLRMLATIIPPVSGECWVNGVNAASAPDSVRSQIGFLSGNTKLYGRLTGREVLRYFGRLFGMEDAQIAARTETVAGLLDMQEFLDRRCDTLSTGQTQKVSIARVILHEPAVLILDEPTLGLDIVTSRNILDFIVGARSRGHSIVFSTHYMSEAEQLCDRIAFLYQGEIMAMGTKPELFALTGTATIYDAFMRLLDARAAEALS